MCSRKHRNDDVPASSSQPSRNGNRVHGRASESVGVESMFRVTLIIARIIGSVLVTVFSVLNLTGYVG